MTRLERERLEEIVGPPETQALWRVRAVRAQVRAVARLLRERGDVVVAEELAASVARLERAEELLEGAP